VDGELRCRCDQLADGRSVIKTIRGFKRLLTELPQPARTFYWCFYTTFLASFVLGAATRMNWGAIGVSGAGVFLFLFGLYVFRDINDTASTWSRIYKESRGIKPESFTFADVPTIRAMGFMHMIGGVFFIIGGIGFAAS
jgi:formate-dependent nitrite reductase membrane component NrfD